MVYIQEMNPFVLQPYHDPSLFCDREDETKRLLKAVKSGRNITLHSIRRMGKTGLIHHLHVKLPKKYLTIYVDMMDTRNEIDFAQKLISVTLEALRKKKKNFFKDAISVFSRFQASFSLDPLTGTPTVALHIKRQEDVKHSLHTLFTLLKETNLSIQLSIDEFQRIASYDKTTIDATLREVIQANTKLHVLFSGSHRHLLSTLFTNVKKPLFGTTEMMYLDEINYPAYMSFIKAQFDAHKKEIDERSIHHILKWTRSHTYYTQYYCNVLFEMTKDKVVPYLLAEVERKLLFDNRHTYFTFRNLLTRGQWRLLEAIGHEHVMKSPTSNDIRNRYHLGNSSSIHRSLEALLDKEMIFQTMNDKGTSYEVYDLFFSRWLQQQWLSRNFA